MIRKLIPMLIILIGLGAGVGAGIALRPGADPVPHAGEEMSEEAPCGVPPAQPAAAPKETMDPSEPGSEFVKLSNQFVFPLVEQGEVAALVVLSLSLEVAPGQTEAVFLREPKLRDSFLRVLLDHANAGGFTGAFTGNRAMDNLRRALLQKGQDILGEALFDVLILDINRQDA